MHSMYFVPFHHRINPDWLSAAHVVNKTLRRRHSEQR